MSLLLNYFLGYGKPSNRDNDWVMLRKKGFRQFWKC